MTDHIINGGAEVEAPGGDFVEAVHGDGADERLRLRPIPPDPCRAEDVQVRDKELWVVQRVVRTGRRPPG